jgi:hypothetical protein
VQSLDCLHAEPTSRISAFLDGLHRYVSNGTIELGNFGFGLKPFLDSEVGRDEWDHGIHTGLRRREVSTCVQVRKKDPNEACSKQDVALVMKIPAPSSVTSAAEATSSHGVVDTACGLVRKIALIHASVQLPRSCAVLNEGKAKEINQLRENESN